MSDCCAALDVRMQSASVFISYNTQSVEARAVELEHKFQAPALAPATGIQSFCIQFRLRFQHLIFLAPEPECFRPLKTEKHYLYNPLAP